MGALILFLILIVGVFDRTELVDTRIIDSTERSLVRDATVVLIENLSKNVEFVVQSSWVRHIGFNRRFIGIKPGSLIKSRSTIRYRESSRFDRDRHDIAHTDSALDEIGRRRFLIEPFSRDPLIGPINLTMTANDVGRCSSYVCNIEFSGNRLPRPHHRHETTPKPPTSPNSVETNITNAKLGSMSSDIFSVGSSTLSRHQKCLKSQHCDGQATYETSHNQSDKFERIMFLLGIGVVGVVGGVGSILYGLRAISARQLNWQVYGGIALGALGFFELVWLGCGGGVI